MPPESVAAAVQPLAFAGVGVHWTIEVVGWLGNAFYFSRFLIQWLATERAGRTMAPRSFWWFSVGGAVFLSVYVLAKGEPVLLFGYVVVLAIYVRNLLLARSMESDFEPPSFVGTLAIAVVAWALVAWLGTSKLRVPEGTARVWIGVGIAGVALWSARFVVQWWMSERRGMAYFPRAFWWLSLAGNVFLLAYVIQLRDRVLIAGYAIGPLVQLRNLVIAYRPRSVAT